MKASHSMPPQAHLWCHHCLSFLPSPLNISSCPNLTLLLSCHNNTSPSTSSDKNSPRMPNVSCGFLMGFASCFLMMRFFSVWSSIVGVPCACPGLWKGPKDVFQHLLLFVDFPRQWVGIRFYNSGSHIIEPFLLSFMNGAQLQQLAMHTVCNLNPYHTSSRVPLAI